MHNAFMSRFEDVPMLVSAKHSKAFSSDVQMLLSNEDFAKMSSVRAAVENDFWNPEESWLKRYRPYNVQRGLLIIPVSGVLFSRFPYATSWATGYDYIWRAFSRGQADQDVKAIALAIHSPGGEVAECFDVAERMFAMRGNKPVRAFANEYAYSAAYALASTADKIVMSKTGGVGSIGVVTAHVDFSKLLEKEGIKFTFVTYGKHKADGNPYEPLSEETKNRWQSEIDELGRLFVDTVARNRNMDAEAVRSTEALTYMHKDALELGLADGVGALEESLGVFLSEIETSTGDVTMATPEKTGQIEDKGVDKSALDASYASGFEAGRTVGQKEEKDRIKAIFSSEEAKERPSAAKAAVETSMTADEAKTFLGQLPIENRSPLNGSTAGDFSKAMKVEGSPDVGNDGGDEKPSRSARALRLLGQAEAK